MTSRQRTRSELRAKAKAEKASREAFVLAMSRLVSMLAIDEIDRHYAEHGGCLLAVHDGASRPVFVRELLAQRGRLAPSVKGPWRVASTTREELARDIRSLHFGLADDLLAMDDGHPGLRGVPLAVLGPTFVGLQRLSMLEAASILRLMRANDLER